MTHRIYVDTNCFLHLRDLKDLPWSDLFPESAPVEIVVAPVVVDELDRLKVEKGGRIRDRIRILHDELRARVGGPLYFPFELSDRPIRPLQGYAFKLPADFVDAFTALRAVAGPAPADRSVESSATPKLDLRHAIAEIEAAASSYAISGLQKGRAKRRGLSRTARSIFGSRMLSDEWAFHYGGREELQFNVGLDVMPDGAPAFRAGVAFSFEPSRSFPDIDPFIPKVARFNAWMRENPETLAGLSMWRYEAGRRSQDERPGPSRA